MYDPTNFTKNKLIQKYFYFYDLLRTLFFRTPQMVVSAFQSFRE